MAADRLEQSALAPTLPPSTTRGRSSVAASGQDVERDAAGRLLDDRGCHRVALARGREDLPHLEGRLERRFLPRGRVGRELEIAAAHGSTSSVRPLRTASSSPAAPLWPRCSFQSSTTAAPRPAPTRRNAKSATPWATPFRCSAIAARLTSFSSLTGLRSARSSCSRRSAGAEPRKVGRGHHSVDRRDDGRQGDDGVLEQVGRELARPQQRAAAAREHVDALRDRATAADLFPGPHLAVQVAECSANGARPEVDAEDDGGFGVGLVVGGAVVRPLGVVLGLAHESVLEQRAKDERHGRPGDACLAGDLSA